MTNRKTMQRRRDRFRSLSQVFGKTILDADDERVGVARDLLVDIEDGRIAYLRIRLRSGVKGDDRDVTVPWSAVDAQDPAEKVWRLRVRRAALSRLARRGGRLSGNASV